MAKGLFIRYDLASPTCMNMLFELQRINGIPRRWWVSSAYDVGYPRVRLALAKKVCALRPEVFANDQQKCQAVLDTIDALFEARG